MNSAAVNMCVGLSAGDPAFDSLGCIPRNGVAGSHGNATFNFWRKHHNLSFLAGVVGSVTPLKFHAILRMSVPVDVFLGRRSAVSADF